MIAHACCDMVVISQSINTNRNEPVMKRKVVCGTMAMLLVAGIAVAATLFLTVTALPYSEAGGGATVDGPSYLYLTISPSAEIHKPKSTVTVYEGGDVIWSGPAVAVSEKLGQKISELGYRVAVSHRDCRK